MRLIIIDHFAIITLTTRENKYKIIGVRTSNSNALEVLRTYLFLLLPGINILDHQLHLSSCDHLWTILINFVVNSFLYHHSFSSATFLLSALSEQQFLLSIDTISVVARPLCLYSFRSCKSSISRSYTFFFNLNPLEEDQMQLV